MFSFLGWLSYTVQRVSLAPLHTRLFVFSGVSCADVILGACCYRLASSAPWSTCFLKSYGVLFRVPGIGVVAEATLLAAIVLNVLFIFSNFVFAALLGLISDEIKQQVGTRVHAGVCLRASARGLFFRQHRTAFQCSVFFQRPPALCCHTLCCVQNNNSCMRYAWER